MNSTEKAFSEAIKQYNSKDSRFIVAFSGGCDSLALLSLCASILGADRTVPVYVNHNLRDREELQAELELNGENCRKLGLDLIVRTIDEGKIKALSEIRRGGIEDAARTLRYEILEEERIRNGCSLILTAHHRDDQIETVVMHLSSGSPMTSLQGIQEFDSGRHLLRPLLGIPRKELEQYLVSEGLHWSTDSTNKDGNFRRNDIRNNVIPEVLAIWPDFGSAVLGLRSQAMEACADSGDVSGFGTEVPVDEIVKKDLVGRVLTLYAMWNHLFSVRELPMTLLDRVLDAVSEGRDCTVGSNMAVFSLYRGVLYLTDPSQNGVFDGFGMQFDANQPQTIDLPGNLRIRIGSEAEEELVKMKKPDLAIRLDPSKFSGCPRIRFAKAGDTIRLKDGSKMVMRLLQDMKIPSVLRCRVPVIEDDSGICAVFGTAFGGKDRICVKFRTSLARNDFPLYIVSKGYFYG